MKRFLLFLMESHDPAGAMGDFHRSFDSLATAKAVAESAEEMTSEILDWHEWRIMDGVRAKRWHPGQPAMKDAYEVYEWGDWISIEEKD